ncbi:MAG TPA: hypothetical protein VM053_02815 [Gemmatimonadaceae bacterium]|nr:hypothetical protein [Gemmatimonadaceae bacterium]
MHYEGQFFLSNFLDGRGLFQKIFSTHFNNWDCYQAREVSFLFGLFDSQAIVLGARLGVSFLHSATFVVSIFVTAVLLWRLIPRIAPRLTTTDSGLLVSLMLVTPAVELSSYYYRPAKALVAVLLMMASWQVFRLTSDAQGRSSRRDAALLLVCAILMALSDPQGVFFILVLIAVIAGFAGFRARPVRLAHLSLFSALVAYTMWRIAIGPKLSLIADGFEPDSTYERVPVRYTFGQLHHYTSALSLWLDNIGHFFGNSGVIGGAACLILAGAAYWIRPAGPKLQKRRSFVVLLVVAGMLFAFYVAMYAKLTSITWAESRLVYYWMPSMVVIAIIASVAIDSSFAVSRRLRTPVTLALGLMICTSVLSLPRLAEVVTNGEQRIMIAESGRVRDCMGSAKGSIAGYQLTAAGAQACSAVRMAAFGSAGPGPAITAAVPNPLLWCRRAQPR